MSAGFVRAGHEVVFAAEKWAKARLVYNQNHFRGAVDLDLSDIIDAAHTVSRSDPDLIVGGPPCQDFSAAGARVESTRADLTLAFAEIVRACRPTWFVMENVPEAGKSSAWRAARGRLGSAEYGLTEVVLDASLYGVPQLRKRRFLIGRQGAEDGFLEETLNEDATASAITVREYLGNEFGLEYYYRHPRHWGRKAIFSIDEPAATVRSTNRPIPPKYTSHPNDAAPFRGVRPLTSRERSRLQTFEREYQFDDDLWQWEFDLMVANAVPVKLAEVVGSAISRYEEGRAVSSPERDFRNWLKEKFNFTDRSAGNVLSRLKRVRRFLKVDAIEADAGSLDRNLSAIPEFKALTPSVKSQLRRAVQLHREFLNAP
jgi:DNA (cytosine-5)-methyltransferase 1